LDRNNKMSNDSLPFIVSNLLKQVRNEEVYSPRRQQYKHYNDNEHAKTDMCIEHYIKY